MRRLDLAAEPNHAQELREVQRLFRRDLNTPTKALIRQRLEQSMRDHVANQILPGWHERQPDKRQGFRKGTYRRRLLTTIGEIALEVPRTREYANPTTVILPAYARRMPEVDATMREMFLLGISTHQLSPVARSAVRPAESAPPRSRR